MQKFVVALLVVLLGAALVLGGRYLMVQQATKHITESTTAMTERMTAQSRAMQAEASARQAELAQKDALRRRYASVVGCGNNAAGNRCTCFDAKAQQVPGIPDDLCRKVVEGGLNWLRDAVE